MGKNTIIRNLSMRSNPCATRKIYFNGGMARRLAQSNNKLRGTQRGGVCQVIHVETTIISTTTII
jgi:hypothetical protein